MHVGTHEGKKMGTENIKMGNMEKYMSKELKEHEHILHRIYRYTYINICIDINIYMYIHIITEIIDFVRKKGHARIKEAVKKDVKKLYKRKI